MPTIPAQILFISVFVYPLPEATMENPASVPFLLLWEMIVMAMRGSHRIILEVSLDIQQHASQCQTGLFCAA